MILIEQLTFISKIMGSLTGQFGKNQSSSDALWLSVANLQTLQCSGVRIFYSVGGKVKRCLL